MELSARDLLDIALVATLIYQVYRVVRGTRAFNVLRGLLVFLGLWVASRLLGLRTLSSLLGQIGTVGIVALVILFQSELRTALERLGRPLRKEHESAADDLARALERLAETRTGALVALERRTPLEEYARTGVRIDALLSPPLLENIFFENSPLHDGGVILRDSRVVAAGCLFPLQASDGYKRYGTRHRAALGLSEVSDALVVIVSEERGSIRLARSGVLGKPIIGRELREALKEYSLETE